MPICRSKRFASGIEGIGECLGGEGRGGGIGFTLGGACLKGLHLVVYEVGWGYLSSAGYELEGGVKRYGGE